MKNFSRTLLKKMGTLGTLGTKKNKYNKYNYLQ